MARRRSGRLNAQGDEYGFVPGQLIADNLRGRHDGQRSQRTREAQAAAVLCAARLALALSNAGPALGQTADPTLAKLPPDDVTDPPPLFTFEQYPPSVNDNVVLQWDEELLQAVRALPPGPTVTAGRSVWSTRPSSTPGRPMTP